MYNNIPDIAGVDELTAPLANDNFDFKSIAHEIRRDFPDAASRLYFIDSFKNEYIRGNEAADAQYDLYMANNPSLRTCIANQLEKYAGEKNSVVVPGPQNDYFVLFYTGDDSIRMLGPKTTLKESLTFVLDHETGHVVTQQGRAGKLSRTLHEGTADAYAALRQIQRFDSGLRNVQSLRLRRAQRLVSLEGTRHADHFTSFVLDKIIETAHNLPLSIMTPQQTADLADRYALMHTPNDQVVKNIMDAFAPFQKMLAMQPGDDTPYRALSQIVLDTKDWEVFKWGAPVLRGYIQGTLYDMQNGSALIKVNDTPLWGAGWNNVAQSLREREFEFNRDQILFGLDLPAPPPKSQLPAILNRKP